jgi:hypothetical protein
MRKPWRFFCASLFWMLSSVGALAQSAWVPEPGSVLITPVVTSQSFRKIWMGANPMELGDNVTQRSVAVAAEFGVTDRMAGDVLAGYSATDSAAFGGPNRDRGLTDTSFGLRFQLLNESRDGQLRGYPTLSARVGGTLKGTYKANLPFSSGDGSSGMDFSILADKRLARRTGVQGEAGYRYRAGNVPSEFAANAGLYQSVGKVTFSGGYRLVRSTSGSDIGDPGFEFRSLREINHLSNAGIGFSHGGRFYQVFAANSLGGRNTGSKWIVGASVTFIFRLPGRD